MNNQTDNQVTVKQKYWPIYMAEKTIVKRALHSVIVGNDRLFCN